MEAGAKGGYGESLFRKFGHDGGVEERKRWGGVVQVGERSGGKCDAKAGGGESGRRFLDGMRWVSGAILVILRFFWQKLGGVHPPTFFCNNEIRNSVEYWGAGNENPPLFDFQCT